MRRQTFCPKKKFCSVLWREYFLNQLGNAGLKVMLFLTCSLQYIFIILWFRVLWIVWISVSCTVNCTNWRTIMAYLGFREIMRFVSSEGQHEIHETCHPVTFYFMKKLIFWYQHEVKFDPVTTHAMRQRTFRGKQTKFL